MKDESEDRALGRVGFGACPHLAAPGTPADSLDEATACARSTPCPMHGVDDQTAIRVVREQVDVIWEGRWEHFPDRAAAAVLEQLTARQTP